MPEVYRRLAYDLDLFWDSNDTKIKWLTRAERWQKHQSLRPEVAELPRPPPPTPGLAPPRLAAADLGQFRHAALAQQRALPSPTFGLYA
jgi:hypothetical protein